MCVTQMSHDPHSAVSLTPGEAVNTCSYIYTNPSARTRHSADGALEYCQYFDSDEQKMLLIVSHSAAGRLLSTNVCCHLRR